MAGGMTGAINGTLTFMVGGEPDEFEKAKPMLSAMGKNILHCGKPGNGEIVKLCNNLMMLINMISTAEGLAMGIKLGMDPKTLIDICSVSTSRSHCMTDYNPVPGNTPYTPANNNYDGGFKIDLVVKDLGLCVEAAKLGDCDYAMTQKVLDYYTELQKLGFGHKDMTFVYKYILNNRKV